MTQAEYDSLLFELKTGSLERCREIGEMLLSQIEIETCYSIYDPKYGDDRKCHCGHTYYRHFDSYEDMRHIGCKYCACYNFVEVSDPYSEWNRLNPGGF